MTSELQQAIAEVQKAKAIAAFEDNASVYGGEFAALRALDCKDRDEAIAMLAVVQKYSIFKRNSIVVVE